LHDVTATRLVAVVRRALDGGVGARRVSHSRRPSVRRGGHLTYKKDELLGPVGRNMEK
jgi:hypothetical protein